MAKETDFIWVFLDEDTRDVQLIPDSMLTFAVRQSLESAGYKLVWDSAPSEAQARLYISLEYGVNLPDQFGVCRLALNKPLDVVGPIGVVTIDPKIGMVKIDLGISFMVAASKGMNSINFYCN